MPVAEKRTRSRCVYCGNPNDSPSEEHVIPEALGGRLTTWDVCASCNGRMGSEVDVTLTDAPVLRLLRFKFKDYLPSSAIPDFSVYAELRPPDGCNYVPGRIRFSKRGMEFQPTFDKRVEGTVTTYYVPDTPEGRKAFEGILSSASKKIIKCEWTDLPPHAGCFTLAGTGYLRYQRPL